MIELTGNLTSLCVSSLSVETAPGGQQVTKITYWLLTETGKTGQGHGPCEMTFFSGQPDWEASTEALKDFVVSVETTLAGLMSAEVVEQKPNQLPEGLVTKGI